MSELVERLREPIADIDIERLGQRLLNERRKAADALERAQKALRRIADNYEDGATLSGTQCAEIAREALGDMAMVYIKDDAL